MQIGKYLKRHRENSKLSQQEVADQLEVDRKSYVSWESDKTEAKSGYLFKLSKLFKVDINELFKGKQPDVVL